MELNSKGNRRGGANVAALVGRIYGRLTVTERSGTHVTSGGKCKAMWLCRCECGESTRQSTGDLNSGRVLSCGCLSREISREIHLVHGGRGQRHGAGADAEYNTWMSMRNRCGHPEDERYKSHAGRGIYVCERWQLNYSDFLADMGRRPTPKHSIDRIDNDASYTCGKCDECIARGATMNCRWATHDEQMRNQRRTRKYEHQGETLCVTDWALRIGINEATLRGRLDRGWSVERALTAPPVSARQPKRLRVA